MFTDTLANRRPVAAALATLAVSGLLLAGCSSTSESTTDASGGAATSTDSFCGTVPDIGANDPSGLLTGFSDAATGAFNGYPFEVKESVWADWTPDHDGPYTVALVTNPPNPFVTALLDSLRSTLDENGVEIVADYVPTSYADVPQQLQQFEEAVSKNPDIIYFLPLAADPSLDAVRAAAEAGIPVVTIQTPLDSEYSVTVSHNAVLQAMDVGSQTLAAMGGEGSILRVDGIPGTTAASFAAEGFDNVLDLCPDVTSAGEITGNFENGAAQAETLKFLSANPAPVGGVLQAGTMGIGVRQAFIETGRDVAPIADLGGSQGFVSWALQNPDYPYAGSASPIATMGATMAEVGLRILAGEGPKVNHIITATATVNRDNIAEFGDDSWDVSDNTDFAGDPSAYFPEGTLDEFFNKPGH